MWVAALLAGCQSSTESGSASVVVDGLSIEVDEAVPTLVHVRWETSSPVRSRLQWTLVGSESSDDEPVDEPVDVLVSDDPSEAHSVDLLGIPAGWEALLTVYNLGDDGDVVGEADASVKLAEPPANLAVVRADTVPPAPPSPWLMITSIEAATGLTSLQVVDWRGRPVWWVPPSTTPTGFARVRGDGRGVVHLANERVGDAAASGAVVRTDWDGTTTLWEAPDVHHDLYELEDGRVAACGWVERDVNGQRIAGEQLMIVGESGPESVVWNSFDALPVARNDCWGVVQTPTGAIDAVHVNGLDHDPITDTYLLSLYCTATVLAVDGQGATRWAVGGEPATLRMVGDSGFGPQHSPRIVAGGFRIFDNGRDVSAGSRVVSYAVDVGAGTAQLSSQWRPPDAGYTAVLGESNDAGEGQIVSVGIDGAVYWLDASGAVAGALQLEPGNVASSVAVVNTLDGG